MFQTHIKDRYFELFMWNCPHVNATKYHLWWANIGSGHGLVPSGNKPLPEPMLNELYMPYGVTRPQLIVYILPA